MADRKNSLLFFLPFLFLQFSLIQSNSPFNLTRCRARYPIQNPLLSVVFTTQGGTFGELTTKSATDEAKRSGRNTIRFLRQIWWLTECAKRYNVPMEIVVVDWPVEDETPERERILKALQRENETIPNSVQQLRILEAPPEFTKLSPPSLPVLEYAGKNVAAKRSFGKFILLGGTDSLPHEGIFQFISQYPENITGCIGAYRQILMEGTFPPHPWDFREFIGWRDSNERKWKSSEPNPKPTKYNSTAPPFPILSETGHWNAGGDFTLCTRPALEAFKGYPEGPFRMHVDSALFKLARMCSVPLKVFHPSLSCFHQPHGKTISRPHAISMAKLKNCPSPHQSWGFPNKILSEFLFSNGKKQHFPNSCIPQ